MLVSPQWPLFERQSLALIGQDESRYNVVPLRWPNSTATGTSPKLTPEQRAGVVRLLQEVYQLGAQSGREQAAAGTQPRGTIPTPSVIETQIDGEFNGWDGETIVKLMNGQIWQQTEYHYHYHYAYMPKVLVYRSGGGYKMKVEGVEKAVGVERLR